MRKLTECLLITYYNEESTVALNRNEGEMHVEVLMLGNPCKGFLTNHKRNASPHFLLCACAQGGSRHSDIATGGVEAGCVQAF